MYLIALRSTLSHRISLLFFFLICSILSFAQDEARFSGSFATNANFFQRDTLIGASNTPQYDHQLFGGEAWLELNYSYKGFGVGVRFDAFNNSNLINPQGSYSDQGLGRWFVTKKSHDLGITVGYIYDQIGSGIIYRAYEERPLAIDNALLGARLTYDFGDNWQIKGFAGKQKNRFEVYDSVIKGFSVDGFHSFGEEGKVTIAPGAGIVGRTLDNGSMNLVVSELRTYAEEDRFIPKYNTYAMSVFNNLSAGKFNWYIEGAYKSEDIFRNQEGDRLLSDDGSVIYTSLSYANKGLGITLEGKRTENFEFRTRPQEELNRGIVNFLPPMTRVNTFRLLARYNSATQFLGELGMQADVRYKFNKKLSANVSFSSITDLDARPLYQEIFTEVTYKKGRDWQLIAGVQMQDYNQEVYEFKPGVPLVSTITPYGEFLYKLSKKKALRFEFQYLNMNASDKTGELVKNDYGDWAFGLVEFTMAPHWTFTLSDMYNVDPGKLSPIDETGEKASIHFPRLDVFYTYKSNRFSLSYVKQVEGVVCSGGICRLEPAFSGVRMSVTSTF